MLRECRSSCIRDSRVEPSSVEKVETEVEEEGGAAVAEFIVGLSLLVRYSATATLHFKIDLIDGAAGSMRW